MGDIPSRAPRASERIRVLTRAYRTIAKRYAAVESLSRREQELLASTSAMQEVREVLEQKRVVLREIRRAEEKAFEGSRALPAAGRHRTPEANRELFAVLDEVSRRIHRSLVLEAQCRELIEKGPVRRNGASLSNSRKGAGTQGGAR